LNEHFSVNVTTGRAIDPITKTNWEVTGVEPDAEVSKEMVLKTAYLLALNKSLEKVKREQMKSEIKRIIEQMQKEIDEAKKDVKSCS
jgi:DnaJ-domain-containing protein 1